MYYLVFLIGVYLSSKKENKLMFSFYLALLFFLAAYRFGVGADYFSYSYIYNSLENSPILELKYGISSTYPLFGFFGSILKVSGFSYQFFVALMGIINLFFVGKLLEKYSAKPTLSLLIYYSFFYTVWTFSALRQGLVLSIGTYYLLETYYEDQPLKMVAITVILMGIHSSAFILIIIYLLIQITWTKKDLTRMSIISVIISFLPLRNFLALFSSVPILNRVVHYVNTNNVGINHLDIQSLARILLLFSVLIFYDTLVKVNKKNIPILNSYILGLNFYFILKTSELIAARMSIYGYYLIILILPMFYKVFIRERDLKVLHTILIAVSLLYLQKELVAMKTLSGLESQYDRYVPYTHVNNKYQGYKFNNRYEEYYYLD